jgi:hypothetical protein
MLPPNSLAGNCVHVVGCDDGRSAAARFGSAAMQPVIASAANNDRRAKAFVPSISSSLLNYLDASLRVADDPRVKKFGAIHLLAEGLRSLDKVARLGLNLSEIDWRISQLELA